MDKVVDALAPKSVIVEKAGAILSYSIVRAVKSHFAVFPFAPEEPIRAELFSVERLEQHGESLAVAQRIAPRPTTDRRLTKRLRDNDRVLRAAYVAIAMSIQEERTVTPAADWLVDNFHVVDEQVHEIRRDLPPGYYRQLPKLADGPLKGYPRVFGLAWAFVAHTDSRFDPEMLGRFISAYQRVEPLTIRELWAVAITLRIVLVENLRRLAEAMSATVPRAKRLTPWRTACSASATARPSPRMQFCAASLRHACRRLSPFNWSGDCAIRIRRPCRRSAGWISVWPRRAPPPTTSFSLSISGKARPM